MVFIPMAVCLAASLENAFYRYLNFQFFSMLAVEKGGGRNHLPQAVIGACCPLLCWLWDRSTSHCQHRCLLWPALQ